MKRITRAYLATLTESSQEYIRWLEDSVSGPGIEPPSNPDAIEEAHTHKTKTDEKKYAQISILEGVNPNSCLAKVQLTRVELFAILETLKQMGKTLTLTRGINNEDHETRQQ